MFKNDKAKMDGYSDDIDTLLVFVSPHIFWYTDSGVFDSDERVCDVKAALFSAVVTAFAAQTYQQLQASDSGTTNQLLAYQIKANPGTQTTLPPALNSTVFGLVDSAAFSPDTSARWINTLFFNSLVLSLAAALFGILAKQWIREYLKWNTAIGDPRENVLVRQIRFEAWDDWNVEGVLWSIPFLLELAMICFLVGVDILLWTLDSVVAVAVTTLVAVFLAGVSAFTVLPIFSKRCPYKSPTAWVLLRIIWVTRNGALDLTRLITRSSSRFLDRKVYRRDDMTWCSLLHLLLGDLWKICKRFWSRIAPQTIAMRAWKTLRRVSSECSERILPEMDPRTVCDTARIWLDSIEKLQVDLGRFGRWQDRDIDSCRICGFSGRSWPWSSAAAMKTARSEIWKAKRPLRPVRVGIGLSEDADQLLLTTLKDIRETSVLIRALEWVDSASQDARVARYIQESLASIHPVIQGPTIDQHTVRSIADWCLFTAMQSRGLRGCPTHLVLAAEVPEASTTLLKAYLRADVMPISFMRERLLVVC